MSARLALVLGSLAALLLAGQAEAFQRVPQSLVSNSDSAGPIMPDFKASIFGGPIRKPGGKHHTAKKVDPIKALHLRLVQGKTPLTDRELHRLADFGDDLAAYFLARQLEATGGPEALQSAGFYYEAALADGRAAAQQPLIRLLEGGALLAAPKLTARSQALLEKRAGKGDLAARSALIGMYRNGVPFGLDIAHADELQVAAAESGDGQAALDLALARLSGSPEPAAIEQARVYLTLAAASETLSVRTIAENLLRTLAPATPTTVSEIDP